ncbi:MAG: SusD/RagB family nutrient-binding outer membrane lipoprotein [Bacteroidota bacterium]
MKRLVLTLFILGILVVSCDKDEFAEMNKPPSDVNEPDMRFLLTNALNNMNGASYTTWFYDYGSYMQPWVQNNVGQAGDAAPQGNSSQMNDLDETGEVGGHGVMDYTAEIRHFIDERFSGRDQAARQYIKAVTYPIQIYSVLMHSDIYGPTPYTEAKEARFTDPPELTPKYDSQQELFNTFLEELNMAEEVLQTEQTYDGEAVSQINPGSQDYVYGGNWDNWIRFINSLKLRIAVRMLHQDRERAISIAEEVGESGIMTRDNEFIYNTSIDSRGPANNFIEFAHGARPLVRFLRDNEDPRLRFLFNKNDFNSMVVQEFFDRGMKDAIPEYIQKFIQDTTILAGEDYQGETVQNDSTVFLGWKGPGEPWVRYFGSPVAPDSARAGNVAEEYFRTTNWQIENNTYEPKSLFKRAMYGTSFNKSYPDVPGVAATKERESPFYKCMYAAAETNLYLAEFALLGADLPRDAQAYFSTAIEQSIETYDWLAEKNDIMYYNEPYDSKYGASVNLKDGEVEELLNNEAYTLSGSTGEKLEKIYLQQYFHFMGKPNEQFVTARRSGIPKRDSEYVAWSPFWDAGSEMEIPRRWRVNQPTEDDLMFEQKLEAYEQAGFTPGADDASTLNEERIWYDQGAPNWSEGPNY